MEDTLVIVKPDAVERRLIGQILSRFEAAGFEIVRICLRDPEPEMIRHFYAEHEGRPYFSRLVAYMNSGPSCFMHLRREDGVAHARRLVGVTDPLCAAPGTIRGDVGIDLPRNSVHASDCGETAERELSLVFDADDIRRGAGGDRNDGQALVGDD